MATRRVATVFGGSGFIGRYVVKRLAQQGFIVRVPSRYPDAALFLKPMGAVGQIVPLYASVTNEATVHRAVEGADVVVNLVGLLTESGAASFQAVHAEGAERIARALSRQRCQSADPDLRHRSRCRQSKPLRLHQGPRRAGSHGGVPGHHDPAAIPRVRPGGQVFQPLRRNRPAVPGDAGDRR